MASCHGRLVTGGSDPSNVHRAIVEWTNERKGERIHTKGTVHGYTASGQDTECLILGKQRHIQSTHKASVGGPGGLGTEIFVKENTLHTKQSQSKQLNELV